MRRFGPGPFLPLYAGEECRAWGRAKDCERASCPLVQVRPGPGIGAGLHYPLAAVSGTSSTYSSKNISASMVFVAPASRRLRAPILSPNTAGKMPALREARTIKIVWPAARMLRFRTLRVEFPTGVKYEIDC